MGLRVSGTNKETPKKVFGENIKTERHHFRSDAHIFALVVGITLFLSDLALFCFFSHNEIKTELVFGIQTELDLAVAFVS